LFAFSSDSVKLQVQGWLTLLQVHELYPRS
jgi:hypothetical protein